MKQQYIKIEGVWWQIEVVIPHVRFKLTNGAESVEVKLPGGCNCDYPLVECRHFVAMREKEKKLDEIALAKQHALDAIQHTERVRTEEAELAAEIAVAHHGKLADDFDAEYDPDADN